MQPIGIIAHVLKNDGTKLRFFFETFFEKYFLRIINTRLQPPQGKQKTAPASHRPATWEKCKCTDND